jgi:hypothetical protein
VLVFYALEEGTQFAAQAAHGTLVGLVATTAFVIVYAASSARLPWWGCVIVAWTAFAVVLRAMFLARLGLGLGFVCVIVAAVTARWRLPRGLPLSSTPHVRPSGGDLPLRLAATATLVLVLTGLADELGSAVSGLLNAFPVLTTIVAAFSHVQRGRAAMVAFLNGYLQSIVGFALFCVVMALTLQSMGLARALLLSLAAQLVTHVLLLWRLSKARGARMA